MPVTRLFATNSAARPTRIAVLGAGGFVGSHLVPALVRHFGCRVEAVDLVFDKLDAALSATQDHVQFTRANVQDPGLAEAVCAQNEVVFSLTALCNPAQYNTRPLDVIDASFTDLLPVVQAATRRGRRLIHLSTCEVYGKTALDQDGQPTTHMSEDSAGLFLGPVHAERWSYACAKQLLERYIHGSGRHHGLPFTIIRPFNVIGPRMDFLPGIDGDGLPRVLANFMGALLAGTPLPLVNGGTQRRSFTFIDDFVAALIRVVARPGACNGHILNLGSLDNDVSIRELAQEMLWTWERLWPDRPAGRTMDVSAGDLYGPGYEDTQVRIPDVDKAQALLDWRATTRLRDMLPGIMADYVAQHDRALTGMATGTTSHGPGRKVAV